MPWSNCEVKVESVEIVQDTNPDTYKMRAMSEVLRKNYQEAIREIDMAVEYGNGELQYLIWKTKVLYELKDYVGCMNYILKQGLWGRKDEIGLCEQERNCLICCYAVCSLILGKTDFDFSWEKQKDNKKCIILLELLMENEEGAEKHIQSGSAFQQAVQILQQVRGRVKGDGGFQGDVVSFVKSVDYENYSCSIRKSGTDMEAAVADMMNKFTEAKENIKVGAGETKDEYFNKVDDSLNVVKGAFGDVLGKIDSLLGYSVLKDDILEIIEAGCNEKTSKKDLFRMADKCREVIERKIAKAEKLGNPDKAATLKELIGNIKEESIFTMFFSTMVWIAKKVTRKLRTWFHVDDEKSVMGSICRSISIFAGELRAGVKLTWNHSHYIVSSVVAGAVKAVNMINGKGSMKKLCAKHESWEQIRHEKFFKMDAYADAWDDGEMQIVFE